jgi:hypothetical protein
MTQTEVLPKVSELLRARGLCNPQPNELPGFGDLIRIRSGILAEIVAWFERKPES